MATTTSSRRRSSVPVPATARSAGTAATPNSNPFQVPADQEIFAMRDREKQRHSDHRVLLQRQKIYEKGVKQCGTRTRDLLADTQLDVPFLEQLEKSRAARADEQAALLPKGYTEKMFVREGLHEFIANKREMFFLQYALAVKTDEIDKLEKATQDEEVALLDEERALEDDTAKFDAYLKENDKNCVEAIRKADNETKLKLEKIQEAKRVTQQVAVSKAEIMKHQDHLADLIRYRDFLREIAPRDVGATGPPDPVDIDALMRHYQRPEQLLRIFSDLEENNLSLIQSCQETEETLEDLKRKIASTEDNMATESDSLQRQINAMKLTIAKEEEKANQLELKTQLATKAMAAGAGKDSQETTLARLHSRVTDAYKKCIGGTVAESSQLSTLQMLAAIEGKLESLLESLESMPASIVEQAEKAKEKERRQRQREQKIELQRQLQEERIRKAMERAQAPVKKKSGKAIMFRSVLPKIERHEAAQLAAGPGDDLEAYFLDL